MPKHETVKAWTWIAGCSLGTRSPRDTAIELLKTLDKCAPVQVNHEYWIDLAETEDNSGGIEEIQDRIAEQLNYYLPMPEYCSVVVEDGEWRVTPYIDDELPRVEDTPDELLSEHLLVVNDHGNVTCMVWDYSKREYMTIWEMV